MYSEVSLSHSCVLAMHLFSPRYEICFLLLHLEIIHAHLSKYKDVYVWLPLVTLFLVSSNILYPLLYTLPSTEYTMKSLPC
jgi:hypothetical protein